MVSQLQKMATELLKAKGYIEDIRINWSQRFLQRHPHLKSRFVALLDKDRVCSEDLEQILRFFELFKSTKAEYNVHDNDVYNMNEKGIMIRVLAKLKVICSRKHKKTCITQQGNKEWVSLIKCISSNRRVLSPYVIFKAKHLLKDLYNKFQQDRGGTIAVSNQG